MSVTPAKDLVLAEVAAERRRQDQLLYEEKIPWDCASPSVSMSMKYLVLAEEFGEVARSILEGDTEGLADELVQLAAVAVAIRESLE